MPRICNSINTRRRRTANCRNSPKWKESWSTPQAESVGEFSCSNELLNRIRTLVRWAQRSNMVSVLTDCPHREKLGWLEQYHLNGPAIRYEFDVNAYFCQRHARHGRLTNRGSGLIPNIAPEYTIFDGTFRAAAEWGCAFIVVPWQQYLFTGDTQLMREYYPEMQKYMDYLASKATDHIIDEGLGDWYDSDGPDRPGFSKLTPPPITATAFLLLRCKIDGQDCQTAG